MEILRIIGLFNRKEYARIKNNEQKRIKETGRKMESNSTYDQEIDLKDLMFAVLHKWRGILAATVILAAALGGYKAVSTYRYRADSAVTENLERDYQEQLKMFEGDKRRYEREMENLKTDIANQEEYLGESVLMNIDPYDIWEVEKEFMIDAEDTVGAGAADQNIYFANTMLAAQAYQFALTNTEFLNSVAEKEGMEPHYLKELLSITSENNVITIQVRSDDEKKANAILEDIMTRMEQLRGSVTDNIGSHSIGVINEKNGSVMDLELEDDQKKEQDRLVRLNSSLETKQKEYEELKGNEPVRPRSVKGAVMAAGIKYAVFGGAFGAFLSIFIVCVCFLMSGKPYSAKELRNRYRLKILGVLSSKEKKGRIDGWLNRLEGRVYGDADHEYELIAANIQNYAENVETLLVVGMAKESFISQTAEKLAGRLEGIKVIFGGNLLQNSDTIKKLSAVDGVVLVEQCGVSAYEKIELEIEKVSDLEKLVIGSVVFE